MAESPGANAVYDVANLFRERCLVEGQSLFWPDQSIWNQTNLDRLWNIIAQRLHTEWPHKKNSLANALSGAPDDLLQISADLVAFAYLYPSLSPAHKKTVISDVLVSSTIELPPINETSFAWSGLGSRIPGGRNYHRGALFADWAYFLRFSERAISTSIDLTDPHALQAFADEVLHDPELATDRGGVWT